MGRYYKECVKCGVNDICPKHCSPRSPMCRSYREILRRRLRRKLRKRG